MADGKVISPLPLDQGRPWWVVHTRPRCEKKLQEAADRQGFVAYLPLQSRPHRYGNRRRAYEVPLFPGYVFCMADGAGRQWLLQNRYTANLLEVFDQGLLVRQLDQLRIALTSGQILEVMPYLEQGRRVRVLAGPLRGLEGIVLRVKGKTRIVLNVDMIRESVVMEMDSSLLAPV